MYTSKAGCATAIQLIRPQSNVKALFGLSFTSVSNSSPPQPQPQGGCGATEQGVPLVDKVKDAAQKIKDKLVGGDRDGNGNGNGDENSGSVSNQQQPTDSSVEDLRNRPGGYS